MRTLALALAVSMAALFGFASSASADATIDLIWGSTTNTDPAGLAGLGTTAITAAAGDHVGLEIYITAGTEGLSSYGISLAFDDQVQVLHPPTEYGLKATVTCTPFPACFFDSPTMTPFTPGVSSVIPAPPGGTGFVYTFEAGTLGNGLLDTFGPFKIGEVWFQVQSTVATDGQDIASGFFNVGADGAYDNASQPVTMIFGGAAVDAFAPEPGTTALLGLGLLGLTLAGRRNRK